MASVAIRDVQKAFGVARVIHGVNISIRDGEFVVLVGPSGCGKSTTLRMIAGLEDISDGDIMIGGDVVNDVPPKDRDIAMVFQSYALYPHMNVAGNLSYSLRLRRTPKERVNEAIAETARILGLSQLLQRRPRALSGGQRQRVAMGRAIVRKPKVFLFDEPLSNLDARLREQMRAEIKKLHRNLGATSVYVTHDQIEAVSLAHRIAVMRDGHIDEGYLIPSTTRANFPPVFNFLLSGFFGSFGI
jgi:multiple sugar transport system ATP-binding protein